MHVYNVIVMYSPWPAMSLFEWLAQGLYIFCVDMEEVWMLYLSD